MAISRHKYFFLRKCKYLVWNFISPIKEGKEEDIKETSIFWAYHTHDHI